MCVTGDRGVGKTSLVHFLNGEAVHGNQESDKLINQYHITLRNSKREQRFRFWDVCGECIHFNSFN